MYFCIANGMQDGYKRLNAIYIQYVVNETEFVIAFNLFRDTPYDILDTTIHRYSYKYTLCIYIPI